MEIVNQLSIKESDPLILASPVLVNPRVQTFGIDFFQNVSDPQPTTPSAGGYIGKSTGLIFEYFSDE